MCALHARMAMSADIDRMDQFEEGEPHRSRAGEMEAVSYSPVSPSMTSCSSVIERFFPHGVMV
jgi:hypothetical protein